MTPRYPTWWNDQDTSTWERVKKALRRDWEQTQNDFSNGRKGADLNQDLDDTLAQATGARPVPPAGVPNPLDGRELRRKVAKAQHEMRTAEREYADRSAEATGLLSRTWDDAESQLRFGFEASRYYGAWNPEVEALVRTDWSGIHPDRDWDEVEEDVRFAWERAARSHAG